MDGRCLGRWRWLVTALLMGSCALGCGPAGGDDTGNDAATSDDAMRGDGAPTEDSVRGVDAADAQPSPDDEGGSGGDAQADDDGRMGGDADAADGAAGDAADASASSPPVVSNTGPVAAAGGELRDEALGAAVTVPAGALSEETALEIGHYPVAPPGYAPLGTLIHLGPAGLTFEVPVVVTLRYDPEALPDDVAEDDLVMVRYDPATGGWEALETTVDKAARTLSAETEHFSGFGAGAKSAVTVSDVAAPNGVQGCQGTLQFKLNGAAGRRLSCTVEVHRTLNQPTCADGANTASVHFGTPASPGGQDRAVITVFEEGPSPGHSAQRIASHTVALSLRANGWPAPPPPDAQGVGPEPHLRDLDGQDYGSYIMRSPPVHPSQSIALRHEHVDPDGDPFTCILTWISGGGAPAIRTLADCGAAADHLLPVPTDRVAYTAMFSVWDHACGPLPADRSSLSIIHIDADLVVQTGALTMQAVTHAPASPKAGDDVTLSWAMSDDRFRLAHCEVDFGDGSPKVDVTSCAKAAAPAHRYTQPGSYTATVRAYNGQTTHDTKTVQITVAAPTQDLAPEIQAFAASPTRGHAPLAVTFSWDVRDANGDDVVCEIDVDDDGRIDRRINDCGQGGLGGTTAPWTYNQTGNYDATLIVSDGGTPVHSDKVRVVVDPNAAPTFMTFAATPQAVATGATTQFSWLIADANGDALACELDVDDDGTAEYAIARCDQTTTQDHAYPAPGQYTARLTVDDGHGGTASQTLAMAVNTAPQIASLTTPSPAAAVGETFDFTWSVTEADGDAVSCTLDVDNDGTPEYTIADCLGTSKQAHTFATRPAGGGATLRFVATDTRGGVASRTMGFNVSHRPTLADLRGSPQPATAGQPVTLTWTATDGDGDGLTCSLDPGDGSAPQTFDCAQAQTAQHTYAAAGDYDVTLTATAPGGFDARDTARLTVQPAPPGNAAPTVDSWSAAPSSGRAPLQVTFDWTVADVDGDALTCALDPGDGTAPTSHDPCPSPGQVAHTYAGDGSYTATFRVSDGKAPAVSRTEAIVVDAPAVNQPPTIADLTATPASGAAPHEVTFSWSVSDPESDALTCTLDLGSPTATVGTCAQASAIPGPAVITDCTSASTVTICYGAEGQFNATLEVTDGGAGQPPTRQAGVTVTAPQPTAPVVTAFSHSPDGETEPMQVTFSWSIVNPTGSPLTCRLSPGDDSIPAPGYTIENCDTVTTFQHTYWEHSIGPGHFTAVLAIVDGDPAGGTASSDVFVDSNPNQWMGGRVANIDLGRGQIFDTTVWLAFRNDDNSSATGGLGAVDPDTGDFFGRLDSQPPFGWLADRDQVFQLDTCVQDLAQGDYPSADAELSLIIEAVTIDFINAQIMQTGQVIDSADCDAHVRYARIWSDRDQRVAFTQTCFKTAYCWNPDTQETINADVRRSYDLNLKMGWNRLKITSSAGNSPVITEHAVTDDVEAAPEDRKLPDWFILGYR